MVPIAANWSEPLTARGTSHHDSWHGSHLPYGYRLLDLSSDPVILLHVKLAGLPIDGMVGVCHMDREC